MFGQNTILANLTQLVCSRNVYIFPSVTEFCHFLNQLAQILTMGKTVGLGTCKYILKIVCAKEKNKSNMSYQSKQDHLSVIFYIMVAVQIINKDIPSTSSLARISYLLLLVSSPSSSSSLSRECLPLNLEPGPLTSSQL